MKKNDDCSNEKKSFSKLNFYKMLKNIISFYGEIDSNECFNSKNSDFIKSSYIITNDNLIIKCSKDFKFEALVREYMKVNHPTIFTNIWDDYTEDNEVLAKRTSEFVSYLLVNGFLLYDGEHRECYLMGEGLNQNQDLFVNRLVNLDIYNTIKYSISNECKYSKKSYFNKTK